MAGPDETKAAKPARFNPCACPLNGRLYSSVAAGNKATVCGEMRGQAGFNGLRELQERSFFKTVHQMWHAPDNSLV